MSKPTISDFSSGSGVVSSTTADSVSVGQSHSDLIKKDGPKNHLWDESSLLRFGLVASSATLKEVGIHLQSDGLESSVISPKR